MYMSYVSLKEKKNREKNNAELEFPLKTCIVIEFNDLSR